MRLTVTPARSLPAASNPAWHSSGSSPMEENSRPSCSVLPTSGTMLWPSCPAIWLRAWAMALYCSVRAARIAPALTRLSRLPRYSAYPRLEQLHLSLIHI